MRRHFALIGVVAVAALVFGVVNIGTATADEAVQTEVAEITPTKLSPKKHQNVELYNVIETFDEPGTFQPPKAFRTVLDLPKQLKINNRDWPTCDVDTATLGNSPTTDDAVETCGKDSLVSDPKGSSATVRVGGPTSATEIPVEVSAFNEDGDVLILYSKPAGTFSSIPASILAGKLVKSKAGKKYSQALDVDIPPLAAGAISFFETTLKKSKFVQAKCKPKKLTWQATTYFEDGTQTSDTSTVKCKPKKAKKK